MSIDYKSIIKQEYIKCAKDPAYFLKKYCKIQHPKRGKINFNLYPFQDKVLQLLLNNEYSIVNKSRQLGLSTLVAGLALWMMTFQEDRNILCIATKQETAKNLVTKVKIMYNNLPSWLKVDDEENNKLTLLLKNGSQIKATSASSDAGRSEAVSLLIIDEAAFIEGIEEIWASAQQTLATGGKCITISTPYGTGNWFHRTWVKAKVKENSFVPIKLPWYVHPERDQNWRDKQDDDLGPKLAAQECDCDFSTSGDTVFDSSWIKFIEETTVEDPIERRGIGQDYWLWEYPDVGKNYLVLADVARGDGRDFSTFHVMDLVNNTQVAEYKGKMGTREFGKFLVSVAIDFNQAMLVVENSSIGWDVINTIEDLKYPNLYRSPKGDALTSESYLQAIHAENTTPGFTMSLKTRPLVINKFREMVADQSINIKSKRTLEEMKVFIWKSGRPEAQSGYNDDLIIPMGIGQYLRNNALRFYQNDIDLSKNMMSSVKSHKNSINTNMVYGNNTQNPYSMKINGRQESIKWLL